MKHFLILVLVVCGFSAGAQNYQCLQAGVKRYFINGDGYLRGMRIDSVKTYADSVVYYPFHTPRGRYGNASYVMPHLDSNSGSWLGKNVKRTNDGTFIFDSYWNDSVIIKTQASVGSSWIFYSDSSSLYYEAEVIASDTMTVVGLLDSIKTILITAQNASGIVASDPVDSFEIILSKDHGFVQVFDLFTFPYHEPDSVYKAGLDFFLDRSSLPDYYINSRYDGNPPDRKTTLFRLVSFINPTSQQLYNWDTGDIIQSRNELGIPFSPSATTTILLDTITGKTTTAHTVSYSVSGSYWNCLLGGGPLYPCSLICNRGTYLFNDYDHPLFDTALMPEERFNTGYFLYYFPNDTSFCSSAPAYKTLLQHYDSWGLGGISDYSIYKLGIGKTEYNHADGEPVFETDVLTYYKIRGVNCGVLTDITPTDSTAGIVVTVPNELLTIYPNPSNEAVTIEASSHQSLPYSTSITNTVGQVVYYSRGPVQTIDVRGLPAGVYNLFITSENGERISRKVTIIH